MNEIQVTILGMVMLVAPVAYNEVGDYLNGAVAVAAYEADDTPNAYDIDVPRHQTLLSINNDAVEINKIIDPEGRVTEPPGLIRVRLDGDRVQLGKRNGNVCKPLAGDGGPKLTPSIRHMVSMNNVIGTAKTMIGKTHPVSGDYKDINPSKVAAWLEMPPFGGLRAPSGGKAADTSVEFRPGRREETLFGKIFWQLPGETADCIVITPYSGNNVLMIPLKKEQKRLIDFENTLVDETTGDFVKGVGFDFLLFYRLIKDPPPVPPVPYAIEIPAEPKPMEGHGGTGVNCGPASLP